MRPRQQQTRLPEAPKGTFSVGGSTESTGRSGVVSTVRMEASPPADWPRPSGLRPLCGMVLSSAKQGFVARGVLHLRPYCPPLL